MSKPKTTIPTDDWNVIVRKIHDRACVPFLGAGVNVKCPGEDGLPLGAQVAVLLLERMIMRQENISGLSSRINWKSIRQYREDARSTLQKLTTLITEAGPQLDETRLNDVLKKILEILPDEEAKLAHVIHDESLKPYEDLTRVALQDLARVSLRYRRNKNLPDFVKELKEIMPDAKCNSSRLLRVLADMPFCLIVTTNYDRLMERALELSSTSDLAEGDILTAKFKTDNSTLSQFIRKVLSEDMYQRLLKHDVDNPGVCIPPGAWSDELARIIQSTRLYLFEDEELMKDGMTDDVVTELDERPENNEYVRRNRLLLEKSYPDVIRKHDKPYELIVQPINGFQGTEENRIRKMLSLHNGLVLYKLHGTFTDALPAIETRPVITEEDYIEFLTYVGPQGENIDKQITAMIKTSTLLFLGYSLEDWNFRSLFKGLIEKVDPNYRPFSYAIQKDPSEFWVRFWEGNNRNVHIFNVDLCEFTLELEERYRSYKNHVGQDKKDEQKEDEEKEARRKARRERSGRI